MLKKSIFFSSGIIMIILGLFFSVEAFFSNLGLIPMRAQLIACGLWVMSGIVVIRGNQCNQWSGQLFFIPVIVFLGVLTFFDFIVLYLYQDSLSRFYYISSEYWLKLAGFELLLFLSLVFYFLYEKHKHP